MNFFNSKFVFSNIAISTLNLSIALEILPKYLEKSHPKFLFLRLRVQNFVTQLFRYFVSWIVNLRSVLTDVNHNHKFTFQILN